MSSDLMIQIVGHKADLAPEHRRVTLEHAQNQIAKWLAALSSPSSAPTLAAPSNRRFPSGSSLNAAEEPTSSERRPVMTSLTSFGLSRSLSRTKDIKAEQAAPQVEPFWKDIHISEMSAKQDEGGFSLVLLFLGA